MAPQHATADSLRSLLVRRRHEKGLTQTELATRLGRPQSFVSKYERGERRLDVPEFFEIAEGLECDPLRLLEEWRQRTTHED
jgi:transcriptional regulator with XRE-family HTH domain